MSLTPGQLAALKADITAQGLTGNPNTSDGNTVIQAFYAVTASPDYWVWRTFVPDDEIYSTTTSEATTWSWVSFVGRSQGERDAWRQMVNMAGGIKPSLANARTGINDIFSGPSGVAQRTHVLTVARRPATRGEKLFAVATAGGSGTRGSTANPDTLSIEGALSLSDIQMARES